MDFVPIRVSTLRGDLKIPFDVYVKVNEKHILYCRQGDSFEGTRLQRLKAKKLKKMFIQQEDEKAYRSYMSDNIGMAYEGSQGKSIENRSEVIQGAQQAAAEDVMEDPANEIFYAVAKEGSTKYVDFILKEDKALQAILNIENTDKNVGHHGVFVATLALGIAQVIGLAEERPTEMPTLVLGGLLHDFEHHHNGLDVARPLDQMSPDELDLYKRHPFDGANRAKDQKHFDSMVMNIILQHEEKIDGTGFPKGLTEKDMDPLTMVAATANTFDRYTSIEGRDRKSALKSMLIDKMGLHPLDQMKALQDVLKKHNLLS